MAYPGLTVEARRGAAIFAGFRVEAGQSEDREPTQPSNRRSLEDRPGGNGVFDQFRRRSQRMIGPIFAQHPATLAGEDRSPLSNRAIFARAVCRAELMPKP